LSRERKIKRKSMYGKERKKEKSYVNESRKRKRGKDEVAMKI
jgi:hypothetical protein